jgi:hypothetical protein
LFLLQDTEVDCATHDRHEHERDQSELDRHRTSLARLVCRLVRQPVAAFRDESRSDEPSHAVPIRIERPELDAHSENTTASVHSPPEAMNNC